MSKKTKLFFIIPLFLVLLAFIYTSISIYQFGWNRKPVQSDVIIILGCGLYGDQISPFLKARLDEGLRLYKSGLAGEIIVSGGKGADEEISEALAMRNYLVEKGVEKNIIMMEDLSTSTKENLVLSKRIMDHKKFRTALIVSNKFHLKRVDYFASKTGIRASFSGVYVEDFKGDELLKYFREILANIRYGIL